MNGPAIVPGSKSSVVRRTVARAVVFTAPSLALPALSMIGAHASVPDRVAAATWVPTSVVSTSTVSTAETVDTYVVKPGDWLSTIAVQEGICQPGANIGTCWEPLYEANRAVIGGNPNLIFPGQVLTIGGKHRAPEPPTTRSTTTASGYADPLPGARLTQGFHTGHNGVDLAAPLGTHILAAVAGRVISAGPASGFGDWVRVRSADGTIYVYGHMYSYGIHVGVGELVTAGQHIADVGSNGDSTGPHLHFEVHPNGGAAVNPVTFMAAHGVTL